MTVELSFSRVRAYQRCPWLYHLVYDKGWRSGPNAPQALGHSLHRALADYLSKENTERTRDRLLEIFDQVWVNEGFATPQETMEAYENGRRMLEQFFEFDRSRKTEVIATEHEFQVPFGAAVLRGSIDRLDKHPDGSLEIVEYKTQAGSWSQDKRGADLQMTLYQIGVEKAFGQSPERLTYYFFSNGKAESAVRSESQRDEARALLTGIAENIAANRFEPNFDSCPRCEFRTRCEKSKNKGKSAA